MTPSDTLPSRCCTVLLSLLFVASSAMAQTNPPVITSSTNALGTVGTPFNYQITASGNPTTFAAFNLPAGLLSPGTNGVISGLPQVAGNFNSQILAVNSFGVASTNLAVAINPPPAPALASPVTVFGVQGQPLNYALLASPSHSNVPTTFSVSGLPAGATLISNVTTNASYASVLVTNYFINSPSLLTNGSFVVPVVVSNQGGASTNSIAFIINPTNKPVFTSATATTATVGASFQFDVTAINNPLRFRVTSIQVGAAAAVTGLNITNGVLTNGLRFSNAASGSSVVGRVYGTPGLTNVITLGLEAANNFGTETNSLVITVGNTTPTVILAQPLSENNYVLGSSFFLNGQIFDNVPDVIIPSSVGFSAATAAVSGTIGTLGEYFGVEFYPTAPAGTAYPVVAFGQNNFGQLSQSYDLSMTPYQPVNALPTVEMLPLNPGPAPQAGGSVILRAKASVPSTAVNINRVEFYVNKVYVGSASSPTAGDEYQLPWITPAAAGSFQVQARVVSQNGVIPLSPTVSIPVWASVITRAPVIVNTLPGISPSVAVTSPLSGGFLNVNVPNRLTATALLTGGNIRRVSFYANGQLIQSSASFPNPSVQVPFAVDFTPNSYGTYEIFAIAEGSNGLQTVSPVVIATVPIGRPPAVSITTPLDNTEVTLGNPVTVTGKASDEDGTVERVELLVNGVVVGTDTAAPYIFTDSGEFSVTGNTTFTPESVGQYVLQVRATDNVGNVTLSSTVTLRGMEPPPAGTAPIVLLTAPTGGVNFVTGSKLFINAYAEAQGTNKIEPSSLRLTVNGIPSTDTVGRLGNTYGVLYAPTEPFTIDTYRASAKDNAGVTGTSGPLYSALSLALSQLPQVKMRPVTSAGVEQVVPLSAEVLFPTNNSGTALNPPRVEFYVNKVYVGDGTPGVTLTNGRTVYTYPWYVDSTFVTSSNQAGVENYDVYARAVALNWQSNQTNNNKIDYYGSVVNGPVNLSVYFIPDPPPGSNADFVIETFKKLFLRAPTYDEYTYYLGFLNGGATQAQTVVQMAESAEFTAVQQVLFGYYARMGLQPTSKTNETDPTSVANLMKLMTNDTTLLPAGMSVGISNVIGLVPSPYGATVGQAAVASQLIGTITNPWNGAAPKNLDNTSFMNWMRRSFNEPYLPQPMPTNVTVARLGNDTDLLTTIQNLPSNSSPALARFGYSYAFLSGLYEEMPLASVTTANNLRTTLSNFPALVRGAAVTYLLSPTSTWPTNSYGAINTNAVLSTNLVASNLPPSITVSEPITNFQQGISTNTYQITGQNFLPSTRFSAVALPANLQVGATNGLITGTPQTNGTNFVVTLVASNAPGLVGTKDVVFDILPPAPGLLAASFTAYAGEYFAATLSASNSPTNFSAVNLPSGLGIDPSSGRISGVPATAGSFTNPVQVRNRAGTASNAITFVVHSPFTRYLVSNGLSGVGALADADPDGDGLSNADEFAFGTKANTADTLPVSVELSGTTVTITWNRRINSLLTDKYTVQSVANLSGAWAALSPAPVPTSVSTNGDYETVRAVIGVPTSQPSIFYRVKSELPAGILP